MKKLRKDNEQLKRLGEEERLKWKRKWSQQVEQHNNMGCVTSPQGVMFVVWNLIDITRRMTPQLEQTLVKETLREHTGLLTNEIHFEQVQHVELTALEECGESMMSNLLERSDRTEVTLKRSRLAPCSRTGQVSPGEESGAGRSIPSTLPNQPGPGPGDSVPEAAVRSFTGESQSPGLPLRAVADDHARLGGSEPQSSKGESLGTSSCHQKLVNSLQTEVDELQQRLKMSRYPSPSNNEDKCNSLQNKHSLEASILTKCIANKFPGTSVVNEPQSQPPLSPQDVIPVYYTPPLTSFKEPQSTMDPICPAERLQAAKLEGNLNAACVTISALKARVVELEPWVSHAAELQAALIAERNCSAMITRGSFYPVSEDDCNVAGLWNSNDCVMEPMVHGDWVEGGVQNEFGGAGCWVHLGGWHRIVRPEAAALTQLDHAPSASLSNEIQEAIDKTVQETFPNENGTPHFTSLHRSHPAKGMDSNSAFPSASTAPVKGVASYKSTSTKPEPEYKALFKEIFHRITNVKEDRS